MHWSYDKGYTPGMLRYVVHYRIYIRDDCINKEKRGVSKVSFAFSSRFKVNSMTEALDT